MFSHFDPALFDDPDFKEDSVREEIVVPILARLGYSASGENQIVRSKGLLHPFVMIGSRKQPVNIIPDYVLMVERRAGCVLDAKRPNEILANSKHAEQAYSYSIHPDIRSTFYALCNGRELVAYDISSRAPILVIAFADYDSRWDQIKSVLSPKSIAFASERHFDPDFGVAAAKAGIDSSVEWLFDRVKISHVVRVDEDLYSIATTINWADRDHLVSFDMNQSTLQQILSFTDEANRKYVFERLATRESQTFVDKPFYVALHAYLGQPTRGRSEEFIPFTVAEVRPVGKSSLSS